MNDSAMARFFGGSPLTVAVRLVVVSLFVGLVMTWLQIDPMDLFFDLQRGFVRLWGTGFRGPASDRQYRAGGCGRGRAGLVRPAHLELPRAAVPGAAAGHAPRGAVRGPAP